MENALKQRSHVAASAQPLQRQTTLGDRIAAVAMLGASAVPGGRCAIAWSSAGPERVVLAPTTDSRWDEVVFAVLAALDNRLSDAPASRRSDSPSDDASASIQKIGLSPREMNAIVRGKKLQDAANLRDAAIQVAASAFTGGAIRGSTVRVVLVADGEDALSRSPAELEAMLELMARSVFAEIALGNASALADFWRAHGAERGRERLEFVF